MSDPATATWVGHPVWQGVVEFRTKQRQTCLPFLVGGSILDAQGQLRDIYQLNWMKD